MITLKGVKKVMLAQKPIFLAYPSESSPSFQNPHSRCPLDLSLVLDEFKDLFQEPPKGLPPLRGIEHQIDFIQGHLCLIGQPIGLVPRRLRKSKSK